MNSSASSQAKVAVGERRSRISPTATSAIHSSQASESNAIRGSVMRVQPVEFFEPQAPPFVKGGCYFNRAGLTKGRVDKRSASTLAAWWMRRKAPYPPYPSLIWFEVG
ncbi:hypothetical protein BN874_1560027 [Candidatus Contendobacter odensis Run_B_J11]|uniref:Uncharacterized protein n=1 Tax=Candidatus Contendobacter odensis Run_B_J11 TaxID=1400861 RepID=A0A7U7G9Z6_9GAMM|nr:hypothetical protein BN874_1560027 [Candidatus Contendobacter odensis Run_B_J11]